MRDSAMFHTYAATIRGHELALHPNRIRHIIAGLELRRLDAKFAYKETLIDCLCLANHSLRATERKIAEIDRELRERAEYERAILAPTRRSAPKNPANWWRGRLTSTVRLSGFGVVNR